MSLSDKMRRKFRNFGIESLMIYVTVTIGIIWAANYIFPNLGLLSYLVFDRTAILHGQVWRLFSFLFIPQSNNPFFMLINLYFYYFIGTNLESYWGKTKFTYYFIGGALLLIAGGFIAGGAYAYYLYFSMFISYALLAPDQQFLFFFVIPIKAKTLAILDGIFIAFNFISGTFSERVSILAAVVLILAFFGGNIISRVKAKKRYNDFKNNFK